MTTFAPTHKRCRKCGESKLLTEFNRDRRAVDGRRTQCRECERGADWRKQRAPRIIDNEKNNARHALHRAVRAGTVTPPAACAHCGTEGPVEGHHNDYLRPLEVTWLCRGCHQFMETLERENHNLRLKIAVLEESLSQSERERDAAHELLNDIRDDDDDERNRRLAAEAVVEAARRVLLADGWSEESARLVDLSAALAAYDEPRAEA